MTENAESTSIAIASGEHASSIERGATRALTGESASDAERHRPRRGTLLARIVVLVVVVTAAAIPLDVLAVSVRRAAHAILGRDQGIFQYVAWAVRHGAVDYRDVRDVNGPLVHALHILFQVLGGEHEPTFWRIDFLVSFAAFFVGGAALPALVRDERPGLPARIAWGLLGASLFGVQYFRFLYWDLAQRESFCDWFLLAALFFVAEALAPWTASRPRAVWGVLAGVAVGLPALGKHTYGLAAIALVVTIDLARGPARGPRSRLARLLPALLGLGVAGLLMLGYLLAYGDVVAFARIYLVDAPRVYRFIRWDSAENLFGRPWAGTMPQTIALLTLVGLVLVGLRALPRRALFALAIGPLGLASMIAQRKGFPYHFHPISLGMWIDVALLACALAEGSWRGRPRTGRWVLESAAVVLASAVLVCTGAFARESLEGTWFQTVPWLDEPHPEEGPERTRLETTFRMLDFFPDELHAAAEFVREKTPPDARVQTYGMDPYVLFQARRLSASPYVYAYDLNADEALWGAEGLLEDQETFDFITHFQESHGADLLAHLDAQPAGAFILVDGAPLTTSVTALEDVRSHQPAIANRLEARYEERFHTDHVHVWLPR